MNRDLVVSLLIASGLYRIARQLHERRFRPGLARQREQLIDFYRRFLKPGDLVFDIGANIGRRTDALLAAGMRVVAVEPNPRCAREITALLGDGGGRLVVERTAVGAEPGEATLMLCREHHDMSSVSREFVDAARTGWAGEVGCRWDRQVTVPVTTLDALIARYGRPAFVKIDVEGYELQVLRGLSQSVDHLSFEFRARMTDLGLACVDAAERCGLGRLNYVRGDDTDLQSPQWMTPDQMKAYLTSSPRQSDGLFGDVYARAA